MFVLLRHNVSSKKGSNFFILGVFKWRNSLKVFRPTNILGSVKLKNIKIPLQKVVICAPRGRGGGITSFITVLGRVKEECDVPESVNYRTFPGKLYFCFEIVTSLYAWPSVLAKESDKMISNPDLFWLFVKSWSGSGTRFWDKKLTCFPFLYLFFYFFIRSVYFFMYEVHPKSKWKIQIKREQL